MTKLIRFDEDHYGYLVERTLRDFSQEEASRVRQVFELSWPGKTLIVMQADEFIDLTGEYEVVRIAPKTPRPLRPAPNKPESHWPGGVG